MNPTGGDGTGGGEAILNGSLSQVYFFNQALTAAQVEALYLTNGTNGAAYTAGSTGFNLLPTSTPLIVASGADIRHGRRDPANRLALRLRAAWAAP